MTKIVNNEIYKQAYENIDNRKIINSVLAQYKGKLDPETLKSCGLKGLWRALKNHDSAFTTKFTSSLWRFTKWACQTEMQTLIKKKESDEKHKVKFLSDPNNILEIYHKDKDDSQLEFDVFSDIEDVLNQEQSKIVKMRFLENMTLEEIGEQMGFTKETARQKLKLALVKIKKVVYNDIEERNIPSGT